MAEDAEQRTFEMDNNSKQFIFNSTELRAVDVEMPRVRVGPTPVGPVTRQSGRGCVPVWVVVCVVVSSH